MFRWLPNPLHRTLPVRDAFLLLAALVTSVTGMGWLALSLDVHWRQVYGNASGSSPPVKRLRTLGALALAFSLALCLSVDHASMAALVWVMTLTAAALGIAFTLTWRAHWLRALFLRLASKAPT